MNYLNTPIGYARVNKGPLDKYEVFDNINDMITYCKNGPVYNGQQVSCKIDDMHYLFMIKNNRLYPLFNNMELITRTINNKRCILVCVGDYDPNAEININDPSKFNINKMSDIFKEEELVKHFQTLSIDKEGTNIITYTYIEANAYLEEVGE